MHQNRKFQWLILVGLILGLGLAGCQSRPSYELTHMEQPRVERSSSDESFWRDSVRYPFPVHYAHASDEQGVTWEVAYMDEYIGSEPDKARTLVLVHGKGASSGYWSELMKEALESGLRVIAFDIPHYGKSIPGNLDKPFARTFEDTQIALNDILVNQLGVEKATFLGHSMGGHWVLGYTLRYPENVDKLVLVATAGFEEYPREIDLPSGTVPWMDPAFARDYDAWEEAWAWSGRLEGELAKTEEQLRNFYWFKRKNEETGEVEDAPVGFFLKDGPDARFETETRIGMLDGPEEEYWSWIVSFTRDIYSMGMELNREDPNSVFKRLTEIRVPVFIAFGEEEPFIPTTAATGNTDLRLEVVKPAFEKLAQRGPRPVVRFYDNAAHFVHTDVPEQFNPDVVDFVYTGRLRGETENPAEYKAPEKDFEMPEEFAEFFASDTAAVLANDIDRIMAHYHPDFRADGRNYAAQRGLYDQYGAQLAQRYETTITNIEVDGNMATLTGSIRTVFGLANLAGTKLIKEDGEWLWYGNRR